MSSLYNVHIISIIFATGILSFSQSKADFTVLTSDQQTIGTSKFISQISTNEFLTSIPAQYKLTRVSEKQFKSELAIDFFTNDISITNEDLSRYRDHVKKCLLQSSELMNGPNEENLQITLTPDNSKFPSGAIIHIEVSKTQSRENSRHYSIDSDCPTITHEILHLHGLVDEYPENLSTNQFKILSCRHTGMPNSIMYNHQAAFERAQLKFIDIWKYKILEPNGNVIENEVALKKGTVFPIEGLKKLGAMHIEKVGTFARDSLLSIQQFNVIVRPGNIINHLYYICAANSTRLIFPTGSTINGQPQDTNTMCIQTPNDCEHPDIWVGNPEQPLLDD